MVTGATTKTQRMTAWTAVIAVFAFLVLGAIWYGFSGEVFSRIWRNLGDRPGGPMTFRVILQPAMAVLMALFDGIKDAKLNRAPYFWTVLSSPSERVGRLQEGIVSTSRIILLAIGIDVFYQWKVLGTFYPGEAAIVAILLAFVPYLLMRGPIARIARRLQNPGYSG